MQKRIKSDQGKPVRLADACLKDNLLQNEYLKHQNGKLRIQKEGMDIGAFEYEGLSGVNRKSTMKGTVTDFQDDLSLVWVNRKNSVKYNGLMFFLNGRALQLNVPCNGVRSGIILGR